MPCKCGSRYVRPTQPTFYNRVKFILHEQPGIFNKIREIIASEVVD